MSTPLYQLAKLVRSKNAGPFEITFDVLFEDAATWRRVVDSDVLSAERMAALYGVPAATVRVFHYEPGLAIKISFARPVPSGDPRDRDVTGGQQYAPLVDLDIP
jgi:Domain of unknown function (DUF4387)